jgi:GTP-binding protein EngB required for normal cell division
MYNNDVLIDIAGSFNSFCVQYEELHEITAPRVVVMGTQSTGKSSVLNNIIGFDVLPTGKNMVTRTPISIHLIRSECKYPKLVLSTITHGTETIFFEIILNDDESVKSNTFSNKLIELTNKVVGDDTSISETPIYLNIYWKDFGTNFSFVDLPGRVLIPKVGQSSSIKEEIDSLIKKQILMKNTIVLVVMQSKTDLETDPGLELFKDITKTTSYQMKTIGVLTKPDIMGDENIHMLNDFVADRMDTSVRLSEGYFVVNNKEKQEDLYFTTKFGKHSDLIKLKRYGSSNLLTFLKKYLVNLIRQCLPQIKKSVAELLKEKQCSFQLMGGDVTRDINKTYYVNKMVTDLRTEIINSIESQCGFTNVGSVIGDILRELISNVADIKPFDDSFLTNAYFDKVIKGFRSYRLTTQVPLERIMEQCINDNAYSPITLLYPIMVKYVTHIKIALTSTIDKIINCGMIEATSLYPSLRLLMCENLKQKIYKYCDDTLEDIKKYLVIETSVIWATDPSFTEMLKLVHYVPETENIAKKLEVGGALNTLIRHKKSESLKRENCRYYFEYSVDQLKRICTAYYKTIINKVTGFVPKQIISGIVAKTKNEITNELLFELLNMKSHEFLELFTEDGLVFEKRICLKKDIEQLNNMLSKLSTY